jgi:hypothetical protein
MRTDPSRSSAPSPTPGPGRRALARAAFLALLFAGGCGDLDTGPLVSLEMEAPVPSLQLGREIPSLPGVRARWGGPLPLAEVEDRWTRSWSRPPEEGAWIRSEAAQAVSALVAPRMRDQEVSDELRSLRRALEAIRDAMDERRLESLEGPVAEAARLELRAREAMDRGDRTGALRWAMEASDQLRAVTPEVLAGVLIREAEEALREGRPGRDWFDDSYAEEERARAERLLLGAREALRSGEPALALRRAWYAVGILRFVGEGGEGGRMDERQEERP